MRPLALELEGFGAFRERTHRRLRRRRPVRDRRRDRARQVDADRRDLLRALRQGAAPRRTRHRAGHDARVQRDARCRSRSSSAGAAYIATRVAAAQGRPATVRPRAALRLERLHADGTTEVLAGQEGRVRRRGPAARRARLRPVHQVRRAPPGPVRRVPARARRRARSRSSSALLDLGRYDRMATAARERAKRARGHARSARATERGRLGDATTPRSTRPGPARRARRRSAADARRRRAPRPALAAEIAEARTGADGGPRGRRSALAAVRVPDDLRDVVQQIDDARATRPSAAAVERRRGRGAGDHAERRRDATAAARRAALRRRRRTPERATSPNGSPKGDVARAPTCAAAEAAEGRARRGRTALEAGAGRARGRATPSRARRSLRATAAASASRARSASTTS